jgi:hypothetical protein
MAASFGHQEQEHPGWNCSCGIWARKEEDPPERMTPVWGEVALWGKVIRYSNGFRAQYAYPKRLYVARATMASSNPGAEERLAEKLSQAYGVPCEVRERQGTVPRPGGTFYSPRGNVGDAIIVTDPTGVVTRHVITTVHADGSCSLAPVAVLFDPNSSSAPE